MSIQSQLSPVAIAQALVPSITAEADRIEREQRVPAHLVEALCDAGMFKLLAPRSVGGAEADLLTFAQTVEAIAMADASVAWCVAQAGATVRRMGWAPLELARTIIAPRLCVLGSGSGPMALNRAVAVPGGHRLTGEWGFASGGHHSTWLCAEARLFHADESPELLPDGKQRTRIFMVPQEVVTWRETWHVSGLRGTGSDTYAVTDLFVPQEQALHDVTEPPRELGTLFRFPYRSAGAAGFASVACGIVRVMIDTLEEVAQGKTPRAGMTVLRDNAVVQSQVGRAEAVLGAARAYLHQTLSETWEFATANGELSLALRVRLRLAAAHAIQEAARAGDMMHMAAGATAVFQGSPLERRFRDLHVATAHGQGQQLHYESAGQFFLGLDPDRAYI